VNVIQWYACIQIGLDRLAVQRVLHAYFPVALIPLFLVCSLAASKSFIYTSRKIYHIICHLLFLHAVFSMRYDWSVWIVFSCTPDLDMDQSSSRQVLVWLPY